MKATDPDLRLESVVVLAASAAVMADDALPEWAPAPGKITASVDPVIFETSARVRLAIDATVDDASFAVHAELLCEFQAMGGQSVPAAWPVDDPGSVVDAAWPHARTALQAAAFAVNRHLPLRALPPRRNSVG